MTAMDLASTPKDVAPAPRLSGVTGHSDIERRYAASRRLHERASRVLPGGVGRTTTFARPHPRYAVRASGAEVVDVDGHRLLDLQCNYTTLVHGHAHPDIVAAAVEAIEDGASFGMPTRAEVELAEALVDRLPTLEQVRFTNSGTEAVMTAIQLARAYTGRAGVLRFRDAYHGGYDAVLPHGSAALPEPLGHGVLTVPFNDVGVFGKAVVEHGDRLACIVLDLMPNRAGLRRADGEFVATVAREARARGIVLIVDEIITFRMREQGLQSDYGLGADLLTLGKLVGGGLPIGAVGGRRDLMSLIDPALGTPKVSHGGTFSANPVSMRAGLTALRLLDAKAIEHINALGDRLRRGLRESGFEIAGDGSLSRLIAPSYAEPWQRAYDAGVLIANNGLMAVSTCMDETGVDEIVARLSRAWAACLPKDVHET